MIPSEDWLKKINEKLRREDVHPDSRAFIAIKEFSKEFNYPFLDFNSNEARTIFQWFSENTKPGSHAIGSMYKGAYYFDSCFWSVNVDVIPGNQFGINPFDSLQMPDNLKQQLESDFREYFKFTFYWVNCFDYACGYDDILKLKDFNELANNFIRSAHKELQATVSLLLEDNPQSKAIETARMAVEMFLKAILIINDNSWEEKKLRKKIGHDLSKAINSCVRVTGSKELQNLRSQVTFFPPVDDRYKGKARKNADLWQGYVLAQVVGAIFTRMFSDRDTRPQLFYLKGE
jgi:hypothetical protein